MAPKPQLRLVKAASPAAPTDPDAEPDSELEPEPELPPLTPDQRALVTSVLPMIESCARQIAYSYRAHVTYDELLGPGTTGAAEAAQKYDPDLHPDFVVYARQYVRFRILDTLRREHGGLRGCVDRAMDQGFDRFTSHQTPSIDSFAAAPENIVKAARKDQHEALAAAFFAALLEARGASPEEVMSELEGQFERVQLLSAAIAKLLPLEREVIHLLYEKDMFADDVAKAIGRCSKTVHRRHASAIRKLRMHLDLQGVAEEDLLGA